jgi:hypothetical protein
MIPIKNLLISKKKVRRLESALLAAIFEYSCKRKNLEDTANTISQITKLECDVVKDVVRAIPSEQNSELNEEDLHQFWELGDSDQFELQDFRHKWVTVFYWMMKYKSGKTTKIEVGNATNWLFHTHKSFSLKTLTRIKRTSFRNVFFSYMRNLG